MSNKNLFIGLMSGTSVDAIDAALIDLHENKIILLATHTESFPTTLRQEIMNLCQPGNGDVINQLGSTDTALGDLFAQAVLNLLKKTQYTSNQIKAIGCHGQTIRHAPNHNPAFTLQIGDPNRIVTKTKITTVADFRRRDLALGGQAAPLAPAFHNYLLRTKNENRWVLNIGGIANLTLLAADNEQNIIGFDTGPGNILMDAWCWQHKKHHYDQNGQWAASGRINDGLLNLMLADPYFQKTPPKSTGREYFNLSWLQACLQSYNQPIAEVDIQATLSALTAKSIAQAIQQYPEFKGSIWVCGGGAKNHFLMQQLKMLCQDVAIKTTADIGIHPDWIEACAFAWLAQQTLAGQPGNIPSVTGAAHTSVLGCIYPKNDVI